MNIYLLDAGRLAEIKKKNCRILDLMNLIINLPLVIETGSK